MPVTFASMSTGKKSDPMKLIKVEIKPDQPKQGQNFTIIATIEMGMLLKSGFKYSFFDWASVSEPHSSAFHWEFCVYVRTVHIPHIIRIHDPVQYSKYFHMIDTSVPAMD